MSKTDGKITPEIIAEVYEYAFEHNLFDIPGFAIRAGNNSWSDTCSVNVNLGDINFSSWDGDADKERKRAWQRSVKRAFGPFTSKGAAPNIYLEGFCELDHISFSVTWTGAYACVKKNSKFVPKTESELDQALSSIEYHRKSIEELKSKTKEDVTYECVPVNTLDQE